mgnify:CR=1 FL=1
MKKFIDKLIPTVLIIIMLVSGFKIVTYFYQAHRQKEIFKSVEQKISENENEKGTTKINYPVMETKKLYDTGEQITSKDKIITLSTCENTNENSRMVVVCKKS